MPTCHAQARTQSREQELGAACLAQRGYAMAGSGDCTDRWGQSGLYCQMTRIINAEPGRTANVRLVIHVHECVWPIVDSQPKYRDTTLSVISNTHHSLVRINHTMTKPIHLPTSDHLCIPPYHFLKERSRVLYIRAYFRQNQSTPLG